MRTTTPPSGAIRFAAILLIAAGLLGGCGRRGDESGAGGATATENPAAGAPAPAASAGASSPTPTAGTAITTPSAGDAARTQSAAAVAAVAAPDAARPPALLSSTVVSRAAGVLRERVVYGNGGLRISGQICRPDDALAHPLVMYQHAGFNGLQAEGDGVGLCTLMASRGYAVAMSGYRGEDGSDGTVEYCLGEVDDSLALLSIVRAQPWVQPGRQALVGVSHGGCITLAMLARGAAAQAAVSLAGPTDWAAIWSAASARAAADPADTEASAFVVASNALLGPPTTNPAAWAARSPLAQVAALRGTPAPLLVLQGAEDTTVPVAQACAFAIAMGGFEDSHVPGEYLPGLRDARTTDPVPGCAGAQPAWSGGDHPRTRNWAGDRHLVVYDRLGHDAGLQAAFALADVVDFLSAKFPAGTP